MNNHQHQEVYYDQTISRPPASHRHPPSNLRRQSSRQFDTYGSVMNDLWRPDDHAFRYDPAGFGGMTTGVPPAAFNTYEHPPAQTWNPSAFTNGNGGFPAFSTTGRMKPAARGRTGLPTPWLDQQQAPPFPAMPAMNPFGGIGPSPLGGQQPRPENIPAKPKPDEELIPTAIVIKNIPFLVKKEQLQDLMTQMSLPLPYAFNYHFDNGIFRGLAFANFTSSEETATVIENLNHFELQGRKLRVEYKKMLPLQERERIEREKRERRGQLEEQHRPMANHHAALNNQRSVSSLSSHVPATSPSPVTGWNGHGKPSNALDAAQLTQALPGLDLNEPNNLAVYSKLLLFRDDNHRETLIFPTSLTPQERRVVHTLAHHMGLGHVSRGVGEHRQVHVLKPGVNNSPPMPPGSAIQPVDANRHLLMNKAATIDFTSGRSAEPPAHNTLRGQQSSGLLGIPDSPGFGTSLNLRAAKSFADLRSYTPSPVPSTASFPTTLQSNMTRFHDYGPPSVNSMTPTLTPAVSNISLGQHRDENMLVNGLGNMTLNGNRTANGGLNGSNGSPRRLRGMISWDVDTTHPQSAGGPIGSNRSFSVNYDDSSRDRGQTMPSRQPRGPATERSTGFTRGRQNGHQGQGSDESKRSLSRVPVKTEG